MNNEVKELLIEAYNNAIDEENYAFAERIDSLMFKYGEPLCENAVTDKSKFRNILNNMIWIDNAGATRNKSDKFPRVKIDFKNDLIPITIPTKKGEKSVIPDSALKQNKTKQKFNSKGKTNRPSELNKEFSFVEKYADVFLSLYYKEEYSYGYLYDDPKFRYMRG